MDDKIRKLIKMKCKLPRNTKNNVLFDKQFGNNLHQIQEKIKIQMMSDLFHFLNSNTITTKVIKAYIEKLRRQSKLPLCPTFRPLNFKSQYTQLIKFIVNLMYNKQITLQTNNENIIQKILQNIPEEEYIRDHKLLYNLDLDIHKITRPSDKTQILSFQELKEIFKQKFHKYQQDIIPQWWIDILRKLGSVNGKIDLTYAFNYKTKFKEASTTQPETLQFENEDIDLEIWTDGSLINSSKNGEELAGAAATVWFNNSKIKKIQYKVDNTGISSTKTELIAILMAVKECKPYHNIVIYTD
jgi:hypothetical protein